MPETELSDLSGFASRLRAALVVEAAQLDVSPDLPGRVRSRVRRRRNGRRAAAGAFVAALAAVVAVAVTLPRTRSTTPAPTGQLWPRVGTVRLQPGAPVEHLADAGGGALYGVVRDGAASYVARSAGGAAAWTVPGPSPCARGTVFALAFVDARHGVAACATSSDTPIGTTWYAVTSDGGGSWRTSAALGQPGDIGPESAGPLLPVAAGDGSLWAVSWDCTAAAPHEQQCQQHLESSTDGGSSWSTSPLRLEGGGGLQQGYSPGTLVSLQITGPRSGYLLSTGYYTSLHLYATHDGWRNWTTSAVPCDEGSSFAGTYQLVAATPSVLYLYCASSGVALYRSGDGGHSWQLRSTSLPDFVARNTFVPSPTVFVAAGASTLFMQAGGALIRSDDAGATWHPVTPASASWLHFADARHGVLLDEAAGAGSLFGWWTTTDGGATWHHASLPGTTPTVP